MSWTCQITALYVCTSNAAKSAKTFKLLPECDERPMHLMVRAEGVVLVGAEAGVARQTSAHPSPSTQRAARLPRKHRMIMDLPAAEGPGSKVHIYNPGGQSAINVASKAAGELQSGDISLISTYRCRVNEDKLLIQTSRPVPRDRLYRHMLVMCRQHF